MAKMYTVAVVLPNARTILIDLCNTKEEMKSITVRQLKEKICEEWPYYAGQEDSLRLFSCSKQLLGDNIPISDYGIEHMSLIRMMLRIAGGEYPKPPKPSIGFQGSVDQPRVKKAKCQIM